MTTALAPVGVDGDFTPVSLVLPDDLPESGWVDVGRRLVPLAEAAQFWVGDWINFGIRRFGKRRTYELIREVTKLDDGTLYQYRRVAARVNPVHRVQDLSFFHHRVVESLPPEKQKELLARAAEEKLTASELARLAKPAKHAVDVALKVPPGVFRVVYADPPWSYSVMPLPIGFSRVDEHYPTMSLDEICGMQLPRLADNAVLFMWATSPLLPAAFKVINAWGFTYKASFVWDKIKPNFGHYNSVRHEILMIATRGNCTSDSTTLIDSVQSIERTEHSRKPERFRELIDTMYPYGERVELFARGKLPAGWAGFGNEFEEKTSAREDGGWPPIPTEPPFAVEAAA